MGAESFSENSLTGPEVKRVEDGVTITYLEIEEPRAWIEEHPVEIARGHVYKPKKGDQGPETHIRAHEIARNVAVGPETARKFIKGGAFITNRGEVISRADMAERYETIDDVSQHGVG